MGAGVIRHQPAYTGDELASRCHGEKGPPRFEGPHHVVADTPRPALHVAIVLVKFQIVHSMGVNDNSGIFVAGRPREGGPRPPNIDRNLQGVCQLQNLGNFPCCFRKHDDVRKFFPVGSVGVDIQPTPDPLENTCGNVVFSDNCLKGIRESFYLIIRQVTQNTSPFT